MLIAMREIFLLNVQGDPDAIHGKIEIEMELHVFFYLFRNLEWFNGLRD